MTKKDKKNKDKEKTSIDNLKRRLSESDLKCSEYLDLAQKVQADFENYKKRVEKETQEQKKYANQQIVGEFLEVKDNLERSLENPDNNESIVEGISLTLKQLDTLLKKHGVEEINPKNEFFDPNFHEAMMFDTGDVDEDTVTEVMQKGYRLHSRVIRPAKVKITKPEE